MGLSTHNIEDIEGMAYVHPTFLYESLWNLIGFIIINFLYKKKKFDGQIVLMYITWYGFGRMFIEMLRTDQLELLKGLPVSVVIGFISFVVGTILLIVNFVKAHRAKLTAGDYTPTYAKISHYGETVSTPVPTNDTEEKDTEETLEEETVADDVHTDEIGKDEAIKRFSELMDNDEDEKGEQNGENN